MCEEKLTNMGSVAGTLPSVGDEEELGKRQVGEAVRKEGGLEEREEDEEDEEDEQGEEDEEDEENEEREEDEDEE